MKKYGIFLGRFQPFHKGHQSVVDYIISKGLEPVIFIGSVNINDDRNPLTFEQRKKLIQMVYPYIEHIYPLEDYASWDEWWDNFENKIKMISDNKDEIMFISHKKEIDKCEFIFRNKKYFDNYQHIFEIEGYDVEYIDDFCVDGEMIHATDIRKSADYAEKVLHPKVFKWLKDNYFWGVERVNEDNTYKIVEYTNWIKVYGGDGTLLRAIGKYFKKQKPFFGVGKGTKNFLMNKEEIIKSPTKIDLKMIVVKYENNIYYAFNEIMIGNTISDWVKFDVCDKDDIIGSFKGGGIIFSTPQGSTGINKSAGGVILPLNSKDWVVSGILTDRKIHYVVEPHEIKIKIISRNDEYIWIDGKKVKKLNSDICHEIVITDRPLDDIDNKVLLLFNDIDEFKKKRRI